MYQIDNKKYPTAVTMSVTPNIGSDNGSIWYKIFNVNGEKVTEGNVPVDSDFIATYNGNEIIAANYIAQYLGVVII
jgi:hypothetical protein